MHFHMMAARRPPVNVWHAGTGAMGTRRHARLRFGINNVTVLSCRRQRYPDSWVSARPIRSVVFARYILSARARTNNTFLPTEMRVQSMWSARENVFRFSWTYLGRPIGERAHAHAYRNRCTVARARITRALVLRTVRYFKDQTGL
jgi:hypothetical protein